MKTSSARRRVVVVIACALSLLCSFSASAADADVNAELDEAPVDAGVERPARGSTVDDARLSLWAGAVGVAGFGAGAQGGAGGQLGLVVRVFDFLEPELVVSGGALLGPGETFNRFSVGARLVAPLPVLRPFVFGALHHGHYTPWERFAQEPVRVALTDSSAGVVHTSGAEAGVGASVAVDVPGDVAFLPFSQFFVVSRVAGLWVPTFDGASAGLAAGDRLALLWDVGVGVPLW